MEHASIVTMMRYMHATDQEMRRDLGVVQVSTAALSQARQTKSGGDLSSVASR